MFDAIGTEASGEMGAGVFPPLNVTQDSDHYYVRAEVPGINAKELEISALGRRLSISGKREIPKESSAASYHRKERAEGEFSRVLTLPAEVDAGSVDARYKAGILTVTLPKAETATPRQIVVQA
jgi:HSP20 family protein